MCLQPITCDQLKTVVLPGIREGGKRQMPRPTPLRVKTGLEKGERHSTHTCAGPWKCIYSCFHWPAGSGGGCSDWAVKLQVFPSVQGKICHRTFPLFNYRWIKSSLDATTQPAIPEGEEDNVLDSEEFFREESKGRKLSSGGVTVMAEQLLNTLTGTLRRWMLLLRLYCL